jgi:hypothetical protein
MNQSTKHKLCGAKKSLLFVMLLPLVALINSCEKEHKLSSEKEIIEFVIEGVETSIEGDRIIITIPAYVDDRRYTPTIQISEKAKISPASGEGIDLNRDTTYIISAEDGSTKIYTIEVNDKPGIKSVGITYLHKYGYEVFCTGTVDENQKTITIDMPFEGLGHSSFFSISFIGDLYSLSVPQNGVAINGVNQTILYNKIVLMDKDYNTVETYKLIVRNTEAELIEIELPLKSCGNRLSHNYATHCYEKYRAGLDTWDIICFVLEGQDLSNIKPTKLEYSRNATIQPTENEYINFNDIVTFEITSESGYKSYKKVKVVKKKIIIDGDTSDIFSIIIDNDYIDIWYDAISLIKETWLIHEESGIEYECVTTYTMYENEEQKYITTIHAPGIPVGTYKLKVELENGDILLTDSRWTKE